MDTTKVLGLADEEQDKLEEARLAGPAPSDDKPGGAPSRFDAFLYTTRVARAQREMARAELAVRDQINMEPARTEASKADQVRPALLRLEQARDELLEAEAEAKEAGRDVDDPYVTFKRDMEEHLRNQEKLIDEGFKRLDRVKEGANEIAATLPHDTLPPLTPDPSPKPAIEQRPAQPPTLAMTPTPTHAPTQAPGTPPGQAQAQPQAHQPAKGEKK